MANVWTKCSASSSGERELAAHLESIDDPALHLFFTIDFIPGAREIDLLLVHQEIGAFILEVKAVTIDWIESVGANEWVIRGRDTTENPLLQAYRQYEGIRDFLKPHYPKLPFIAVSACLPKIKRSKWLSAFGHAIYASEIAKSMLFEDDLFAGPVILVEQLKYIYMNPPVRQGGGPRTVRPDFLRLLRSLTLPARPHAPTQTELERLRAIERGITAKLQQDFPPGLPRHSVFSGRPGTGKTFRLLSVGAFHAYASRQVLFVCFNKTLASDIRRLLGFSEKLALSAHQIDVLDINQLAIRCFEMNGMAYVETEDADEWGELVVETLQGSPEPSIQKYDTILVDEAQDLKEWQLDLLEIHATPRSTLIIAIGTGQELYRDAASATAWLEAFAERDHVVPQVLRSNFRNPREQYFFAAAFYEAWPADYAKIDLCRKRLFANRKQELLFDRNLGDATTYISMPVNSAEFDDLGRFQDETFAKTMLPVLKKELEQLIAEGGQDPVGLLVLVPNQDGLHARAVRIALESLCEEAEVGYIDYTHDETRRASASRQEVRLCTFHSARGLEGERVVVFGIEAIEGVAEASQARPENLAFIALSRGVFATTVAVRASPRNTVHLLCEAILQCARMAPTTSDS